jgi:hypothetical protein
MRQLLSVFLCACIVLAQQNGNPRPAAFPASVATDTTLGVACNSARSTLDGGINDSVLSFSVASGVTFCAPAYYTLGSGTTAEVIKICSASGATVTVCAGGRGIHGPARAHANGTPVQILNDENYHNQLAAEVKAIQNGLGAGFLNTALLTRSNVFAGTITATGFSGPLAGNADTVTNGVYTTGSYNNPAWITGLAWGKLSGVPSTFTPSAHTHPVADLSTVGDYSSKITSGTYSIGISGNAATATTATNATNATNATAVPWTGVSGKPATFAPSAHASSHVQGAADALTGTYTIHITGNASGSAGSAGSVPYTGVTGKPAFLNNATGAGVRMFEVGCSGSWATSCDAGQNGLVDTADNANAVGGLVVHGGTNNEANKVVRTQGNGYIMGGYFNSSNGIENPAISSFVVNSGDGFYRYGSLDNAARQVVNVRRWTGSFALNDPYLALQTGVVVWGVFQPQNVQSVIDQVQCWSDTNDATINLRRNDGGDFINGNLACNGSQSTNINNGYHVIPVGMFVGAYVISGSAKSIRIGYRYYTNW